jgi:hypothetical protein
MHLLVKIKDICIIYFDLSMPLISFRIHCFYVSSVPKGSLMIMSLGCVGIKLFVTSMFQSTLCFRSLLICCLVFCKYLSLNPSYLLYSLMVLVIISSHRDVCYWHQNFSYRNLREWFYTPKIIPFAVDVPLTILNLKLTKLVIIFTRKNNAISNKYNLCDKCITHIDSVRNPGVLLDPK